MTLVQAIGRMEGFAPGSGNRPTRNNNPGNLEWGPFTREHGATRAETLADGSPGRFAYFETREAGFAALEALLRTAPYVASTVQEAIARYAPPVDGNDDGRYVANVCFWTRCSFGDKVGDVLDREAVHG